MTHVAARGAASDVNETLLLVLDAFIAMLQCILFSVMTAFDNKIVLSSYCTSATIYTYLSVYVQL